MSMLPPPAPGAIAAMAPPAAPSAAAPVLAPTLAVSNDDPVALLESQTKLLEDLLKDVRQLKDRPARLLAAATGDMKSAAGGIGVLMSGKIGQDMVKGVGETISTLETVRKKLADDPSVGRALEVANSGVIEGAQSELASRKRKRHDSDAAFFNPPKPTPAASARKDTGPAAGASTTVADSTTNTLLPPEFQLRTRISSRPTSLIPYLKRHNGGPSPIKLRIWQARKGMKPKPDAPTVLKMTMPEVFDAFVTLEMGEHEMLVTAVNVFGIAEEKPLHSRSDYNIFRMLTQFIMRLVNNSGEVSIQRILSFLENYTDLFSATCNTCGQVLSTTDHIPPIEYLGDDTWRHPMCQIVVEEEVDENGNPKPSREPEADGPPPS